MRILKFLCALVLAVVVHLVAVRLLPVFPRLLDLFLVVLVLNARGGSSLMGLSGGLAAGLVEDAISGGLYGLHGFAGTLVGYAAARTAQLFVVQQLVIVALFFTLAAALQQTLLISLRLFLLEAPEVPSLGWLVWKCVNCGLLGTGLFSLNNQLKTRVLSWRRRRTSKLRLGKGL